MTNSPTSEQLVVHLQSLRLTALAMNSSTVPRNFVATLLLDFQIVTSVTSSVFEKMSGSKCTPTFTDFAVKKGD